MKGIKELIVIFLALHITLAAATLPLKYDIPPTKVQHKPPLSTTEITPKEDSIPNNNIYTEEPEILEDAAGIKPTDLYIKHVDPQRFKMAHIISVGLIGLMIVSLVVSVYLMKKRRKKQMTEKMVKSKINRVLGETNNAFDPVIAT